MGLISNGTTIFDAGSMSAGFGGSMVFIKKLTASASGTLTFHHGVSSVIFLIYSLISYEPLVSLVVYLFLHSVKNSV